MVEGILGPIAQLFNWVLIGVVLVAVIKLIVVLSKDPRVKQKVFAKRRKSPVEAIITPSPEVKKSDKFKYNTEEEWPFKKKRLITKTEETVYRKLKEALPNHEIMAQVQLSQVIDVKKGHSFYKWFNRINRMSVDFVVLDEKLETLAVIEVDDVTHRDPKRMEADDKKNKALRAAKVKILRWEPSRTPAVEQIAKYFNAEGKREGPETAKA